MKYRLQELRENKQLTRQELSKKANVSRATIWKIETDENAIVKSDTLDKLAKALGVKTAKLFFKN